MLSAAILVQSLNPWTASPANVQERTHCKPLPTQLHTHHKQSNNHTHRTTHSYPTQGTITLHYWPTHRAAFLPPTATCVLNGSLHDAVHGVDIRQHIARPEEARCQCLHWHVGISQRYLHTVHTATPRERKRNGENSQRVSPVQRALSRRRTETVQATSRAETPVDR